jgi:hypothetical protein
MITILELVAMTALLSGTKADKLVYVQKPVSVSICTAVRWYTYAWYDKKSVIVFHAKEKLGQRPRASGIDFIEKLDINTQKQETLLELNKFWNQHHTDFTDRSYIHFDVRGDRLLWSYHAYHNFSLGNHTYIYDFKNKKLHDATDVWLYNPIVYWNLTPPEITGIDIGAEMPVPQTYTTYNFLTGKKTTHVLPPSLQKREGIDYLGVRHDGCKLALVLQETSNSEQRYSISLVSFGGKKQTSNLPYDIPQQPQNYTFVEAYLSPNGRYILWLFTDKQHGKDTHRIWLSTSQGHDMHEVTTLQAELDGILFSYREFRWTTDSKCITYIYKDTLYKIPVLQ